MPGIIDLTKFNCEDLEEIVGRGSFGVTFIGNANHCIRTHFGLVTWRPYCPGRPEKLCFTTPSIAVETIGVRRGKTKLFRLPGQYGRRVITATTRTPLLLLFIPYKFLVRMMIKFRITKEKKKRRTL